MDRWQGSVKKNGIITLFSGLRGHVLSFSYLARGTQFNICMLFLCHLRLLYAASAFQPIFEGAGVLCKQGAQDLSRLLVVSYH